MGIMNIAKGLLGGRSGGSGGSSVGGVMNLIDRAGGVDGLVSKLQSSGLQDKVGSWVGTGSNQSVSGDELRNAVGDDELRQSGVDPNDSEGIAAVLPDIIDKLSPGGNVARGDQLKGLLDGLRRS